MWNTLISSATCIIAYAMTDFTSQSHVDLVALDRLAVFCARRYRRFVVAVLHRQIDGAADARLHAVHLAQTVTDMHVLTNLLDSDDILR